MEGTEEESIQGLTQVKNADELKPHEFINLPLIAYQHSNFKVLRKNQDIEIFDEKMIALIQGN